MFFLAIGPFLQFVSFAAAGDLDTTFDTDGKAVLNIGSSDDFAFGVVVQSNGKIVVAGDSQNTTNDFCLVRYNTDGTLDSSFGTGGIVVTPVGTGSDFASDIALQTDGKILVAGFASVSGNENFALVRYESNGSLDTTFGTGGKVFTNFAGIADDEATSLAVQSDGKIVLAGLTDNGLSATIALARYETNGALDTGFDGDGLVTTSVSGIIDLATDVKLQTDGKIVIAGRTGSFSASDFLVARYQTNGTLDTGFDGDGIAVTDFASSRDGANSLSIQAGGKIVAGGFSGGTLSSDFALARYNTNGTLDTSFSGDGKVTTSVTSGADTINDLAIYPNGVIVVAGSATSGTSDFALAEYEPSGILFTSFGNMGIVTTQIGANEDTATAIALQSDNKIVTVGGSFSNSDFDFAIARYIPFAATAALGNIKGRILDTQGNPIIGMRVTLTNVATGETLITTTNEKGYYVFESLPLGNDFIVQPQSRKYLFSPSSNAISLVQQSSDFNFIAQPND